MTGEERQNQSCRSNLRVREWQPIHRDAGGGSGTAGEAGRKGAAGASERAGNNASLRAFRTDTEITGTRARAGEPRELRRWEPVGGGKALPPSMHQELEAQGPKASRIDGASTTFGVTGWDQFKANQDLFGVVSTFKTDLSQYSTPLNKSNLPTELRKRAERIAKEIEVGASVWNDGEAEGDVDEEQLFASVPRVATSGAPNRTGMCHRPAGAALIAPKDAQGEALLAKLRAGAATTTAVSAEGPSRTDYRAHVAPKVQGWWRAKRLAGKQVPPGAEDGLICPFSGRVFGDLSQLVMHWAAALPCAEVKNPASTVQADVHDTGTHTSTQSNRATEEFQRAGQELRWVDIAGRFALGPTLSVQAPRPGSVWEQILTRLTRRGIGGQECLLEEYPVGDFVQEAVLMKCWRRDQKVEHREVLEAIATCLALHVLDSQSVDGWAHQVGKAVE